MVQYCKDVNTPIVGDFYSGARVIEELVDTYNLDGEHPNPEDG